MGQPADWENTPQTRILNRTLPNIPKPNLTSQSTSQDIPRTVPRTSGTPMASKQA